MSSASPSCHLAQQDFFEGLRGMPIYGPDGLQGTPERTKGSKKSRIDKNNGWTDWDLKVAKMTGASRIEMDQRRNESRIWVEEFRERVRRQIAGREDGRLW